LEKSDDAGEIGELILDWSPCYGPSPRRAEIAA
jgi:hypothetical protein